MTKSGQFLVLVAGTIFLAGCNQSQQVRIFDDGTRASIRQWQAEAALLPVEARGRYLADRMAGLLPDDTLDACRARR